jgi:hypothetical protein
MGFRTFPVTHEPLRIAPGASGGRPRDDPRAVLPPRPPLSRRLERRHGRRQGLLAPAAVPPHEQRRGRLLPRPRTVPQRSPHGSHRAALPVPCQGPRPSRCRLVHQRHPPAPPRQPPPLPAASLGVGAVLGVAARHRRHERVRHPSPLALRGTRSPPQQSPHRVRPPLRRAKPRSSRASKWQTRSRPTTRAKTRVNSPRLRPPRGSRKHAGATPRPFRAGPNLSKAPASGVRPSPRGEPRARRGPPPAGRPCRPVGAAPRASGRPGRGRGRGRTS